MLFLVDDSSSMRLSQDNLNRNFPTFMTALHGSRRACPTSTSPSSRRTWARATARSSGCDATRRQERHLPVHARAAPARRPACRRARRTSRTSAASANYTGNLAGRVHLHRGARRERLRLRAPVRLDPARARRRRPRRPPAENQGFLRPDAYLVDRPDHQRGRLLRVARRAAVRHRLEHEHRVAARPARELPLQRVRPPLRRRRGNSSARTATRPNNDVDRDGHLPRLHVERHGRLPARRRSTPRNRIKALKADPSQVIVAAITGPATPYTVELEGARARPTPRAARRPARGRSSRTRARRRDGSFADPVGAHRRVREPVRRQRPRCCRSAPTTSRPSLDAHRDADQRVAAAALHHAAGRQQARHAGARLHGRQPHLERHSAASSTRPCRACAANGGAAPCWQLDAGRHGLRRRPDRRRRRPDPNVPTSTAQNATVNCALCDPDVPRRRTAAARSRASTRSRVRSSAERCSALRGGSAPGGGDKSPLSIAGDARGVLCLHGITGTPFEIRPLAEALGRRGCTVRRADAGGPRRHAARPGRERLARLAALGGGGAGRPAGARRRRPGRDLRLLDGRPAGAAAGAAVPGADLGAGRDVDAAAPAPLPGGGHPRAGAAADRFPRAPGGVRAQAGRLGHLRPTICATRTPGCARFRSPRWRRCWT